MFSTLEKQKQAQKMSSFHLSYKKHFELLTKLQIQKIFLPGILTELSYASCACFGLANTADESCGSRLQ